MDTGLVRSDEYPYWHFSSEGPGAKRLSGLDDLCQRARTAGLDYITLKALDGAQTRFLTDSQLAQAKQACARAGLRFSLWQYVYAKRPPSEEAQSFANLIGRFQPAFVFIDVEKEYESNPGPVSAQYASAFRAALPHFPATIAPFGRADLHPGIDYKAWHDHGFGVAPQAYACDSGELTPSKCAQSFARLWPVDEQWTVVGFHRGALGKLSGAVIGASLRALPVANISGWFSGEATMEQMRGIASHPGPVHAATTQPLLETSVPAHDAPIETVQRQLSACGFTVAVDGALSAQTREALRFFQIGWCGERDLQDADGELTPETREALAWAASHGGGLGQKAKNFHYQEFRLDNTGDPRVRRTVGLAAQAYRDRFGPMTILSSARSVGHNQAVGGTTDSRHLFPKHWDAIDPSPQGQSVSAVRGLGVWTGIGHHAAAPQSVGHIDLRTGFSPANPSVFPDH
jgi:Putative peptidoglycan binding domain/Peptidase M15